MGGRLPSPVRPKGPTYVFRDEWKIPFPREAVWPHVVDATSYPEWWGAVYREVTPLNDLPPDQVGSMMAVLARGRLPYQIRFTGKVTRVEPHSRLGLVASGDLEGEGLWELEPAPGGTAVTFHWTVVARKAMIRLLTPLLKPVFAWNHRWTMQVGEKALIERLAERSRERSRSVPGYQSPQNRLS